MMDDSYILFSDFVRTGEEKGNLVETFAELLDKIFEDRSKLNKIIPIYVATGDYGFFSLEPLFAVNLNGNPLIFSTSFRLAGADENDIEEDSEGENFIYNVYNANNEHVYNLGAVTNYDEKLLAISSAKSGNLRVDTTIDTNVMRNMVMINGLKPFTHIDLDNGGMLDVYELNSAMMDSITLDKNFNNGQQTIVDFDHKSDVKYIIAVGGNPIIRNMGIFSDSYGFIYTLWAKNDNKIIKNVENIVDYIPFDLIEPDITDMSSAIAEHIILHRRENQVRAAEENMENLE